MEARAGGRPSERTFRITCDTPDAIIRYEFISGSDVPKEVTEFSQVVSNNEVTISSIWEDGYCISARGYKEGYEPSDMAVESEAPV